MEYNKEFRNIVRELVDQIFDFVEGCCFMPEEVEAIPFIRKDAFINKTTCNAKPFANVGIVEQFICPSENLKLRILINAYAVGITRKYSLDNSKPYFDAEKSNIDDVPELCFCLWSRDDNGEDHLITTILTKSNKVLSMLNDSYVIDVPYNNNLARLAATKTITDKYGTYIQTRLNFYAYQDRRTRFKGVH